MKCPAEIYRPSTKPYRGLPEIGYPFHDRDVLVTACGRICMHRKKIYISTVMAGQRLGIKEVEDGIWLVSFMTYDLGYIDLEQKNPADHRRPVRHEGVTHVLGTICYPCLRYGQAVVGGEGGIRTHGTRKGTTVFETAPFDHSGHLSAPHIRCMAQHAPCEYSATMVRRRSAGHRALGHTAGRERAL